MTVERYRLYTDDQSGLCNEVFPVALAVGSAHLPVPNLSPAQFRMRTAPAGPSTRHAKSRFVGSVFVDPRARADTGALAEFAGDWVVFSDADEEILHLGDTSLGCYARVVFEPRPSFHEAVARVVPRKPYRALPSG